MLVYAQGLNPSAQKVFWVNNTVAGCSRSPPERTHEVNENRLSKFELALLMTKLIDVCTVEVVQYNFTEHFYRHPKESDELMQAGLASEAEVFAILSLSRSFVALHSNPAPLTRYCRPNKQDTTNADSGGGTLPRCGPLATAP